MRRTRPGGRVRHGAFTMDALEPRVLLAAALSDEFAHVPGPSGLPAAIADLDGDGHDDLVFIRGSQVATGQGHALVIRLGNGDGTYRRGTTIPMSRRVLEVQASRLSSGEGVDLAVLDRRPRTEMRTLRVYRNDGDLRFTLTTDQIRPETFSLIGGVAFDGPQGRKSLLVRDGTFIRAIKFTDAGSIGTSPVVDSMDKFLAIGDLDQDGREDLIDRVVNNHGDVEIRVQYGRPRRPTGWLQRAFFGDLGGATQVLSAVVADFNQDGQRDIVFNDESGMFMVQLQGAALRLADLPPINSTVLPTPACTQRIVAVGEVNDDGLPDILVETICTSDYRIPSFNRELILMQSGGVSGYDIRSLGFGGGSLVNGLTTPLPEAFRVTDVDRDGRLDIFSAQSSLGSPGLMRSITVGGNLLPTVGNITVSQEFRTMSMIFRLAEAGGVVDPDGRVQQVEFWFDSDDDGVLTDQDQRLGAAVRMDTDGVWRTTLFGVLNLNASHRVFARAMDNLGFWGAATAIEIAE